MLKNKEIVELNISDIKCQYNPKRYHLWHKVCKNLDIKNTPHVALLNGDYKRYVRYYELLCRERGWIDKKITKFLTLFEDIKNGENIDLPEILRKPMFTNPFNSGYEIYEGHHRLACMYVLKLKPKVILYDYEESD